MSGRRDAVMMAACGAAMGTLAPVLLHQVGVLGHLPDPPGRVFDSDTVTESEMAHPMGVPDAVLGLLSYGVTMGLIVAGRRGGLARRLLGWKLAGDGAMAAVNVVRQVVVLGKVCAWCTGTAVATGVMVWAGRGVVGEEVLRGKDLSKPSSAGDGALGATEESDPKIDSLSYDVGEMARVPPS